MDEVTKKLGEIVAPTLKKRGYELYSLSLSRGKNATLSIVVDRVEPISLEDIVSLSEDISNVLDEADPIKEAYTLDVSSLGAEKPIALDRLGEYEGRYVNLHLSHPYKGENILEGTLQSVDEEEVTLLVKVKTRKNEIKLIRANIDSARLAIEF